MAHELLRIEERLTNVPHLVHPATFETILNYLDKRKAEDFHPTVEAKIVRDDWGNYAFNDESGVAVMNIDGPLTYKPLTIMGMECGGANYQTIKKDFAELVGMGAKTIALNISSGGGEAYQCFATARYIRELAQANDVKIISFVDGLAASAAYALACAGDEIIVAEGSEVGSIGVLVRLLNDSKALEQEGYERVFVTAGKEKIPYAADGSFRPEFLADIQEKVDALYTEFTGFVAERRNLSVESVIATEAKTFVPEKAKQLGLIDKVMTIEGFYEYLADTSASPNIPERNSGSDPTNMFNKQTNEETLTMEKIAELEGQLATALAAVEAKGVELTAITEANAKLVADLAKANEQLAELNGVIASNKQATRLATLKQYLADEGQAEAINASLVDAGDAVFEAVVGGYKAQHEKLKTSDLFAELGEQGGDKEVQLTAENKILEATRNKLPKTNK